MTLKEYIKQLSLFAQEYPDALDMEVIYSSDDEGNNFQKVDNTPSFTCVDDFNIRDLDIIDTDDEDEFNAVIIN